MTALSTRRARGFIRNDESRRSLGGLARDESRDVIRRSQPVVAAVP